jgi:plasmid stabilization system protein ParE
MQVIWTDPALGRVEEIAVYIAQNDPDAADRWTVGLFDAVERLIDFPESGRMVPELGVREARELIFGAYRVFYRVGLAVEVLSVRHCSQLLRPDEVRRD